MQLGEFKLENKRISFKRLSSATLGRTIIKTPLGCGIGGNIFCTGNLDQRKHFRNVITHSMTITTDVNLKFFKELGRMRKENVTLVKPLIEGKDEREENILLFDNGWYCKSVFIEYFISRFGSSLEIYSQWGHPIFVVRRGKEFLGVLMGLRGLSFSDAATMRSESFVEKSLDSLGYLFSLEFVDIENLTKIFKRQQKEILLYEIRINKESFKTLSEEVLQEYPDIKENFS